MKEDSDLKAPVLAVAGVLVHGDGQWPKVDRRILALIEQYIPKADRPGFISPAASPFERARVAALRGVVRVALVVGDQPPARWTGCARVSNRMPNFSGSKASLLDREPPLFALLRPSHPFASREIGAWSGNPRFRRGP
jgi:hypothetical protein